MCCINRTSAPGYVCKRCREINHGCKGACRDAFVYTDDTLVEKVDLIRKDYKIGGNKDGLDFNLVLPDVIKRVLIAPAK